MKTLGLYIHIPFCRKKCAYCDFYSVVPEKQDIEQYLLNLQKEIKYYAELYQDKFVIDTIYVGGGTPSLLECVQVKNLFQFINGHFKLNKDCEKSIEVNPESVTDDLLSVYKDCFNRISIGVQTFHDKILNTIGRLTDKKEIYNKLDLIKKYYNNFSLDLIMGLPYQEPSVLKEDLIQAVSFDPKHLSLYSLTLNKKVPLYQIYKKLYNYFSSDEDLSEQYVMAEEFLKSKGLIRYEISNYALPSYESQHNLKYWMQKPYLGGGASAVSTIDMLRWKNPSDLKKYQELADNDFKKLDQEKLDPIKIYNEKMMLGLRLKDGVSIDSLNDKEKEYLKQKQKKIEEYIELDLMKKNEKRMYLTTKGALLSNHILSELMV